MRNNLRKIRLREGFHSLTPFAAKLGVSTSYISKVELGDERPSVDFILKAKNLLKEDAAIIFPRDTKEYIERFTDMTAKLRGET